jgi:hypothetical protein
MELELIREYLPKGTNGKFYDGSELVCCSIELPWKNNETETSCIPEGRYELVKRFSIKFQWHLILLDVKGREDILVHPANNALKELRGCIAPILKLTGPGLGSDSKKACKKVYTKVFAVLDKREKVYLTIKSKTDEYFAKSGSSNTNIL